MSKLAYSTALAALLAFPVSAQTTTQAPAAPAEQMPSATEAPATEVAPAADASAVSTAPVAGIDYAAVTGDMSAETFIGKRLYVSESDVDVQAEITEIDEGWDDIGEISDLILGSDGMVKAVLVDIGGFIGIGEKSVAVSMDQLKVIRDGDSENEYFIVFTSTKEALESAPEFKWADE